MGDQAEVKRVRMSLQDVIFNQATKEPKATLVLEIPLEDVQLEQGHITPIFRESWEKGGRSTSRTVVARIGDRFGKVYKDLGSLDPSLKGYRIKLSILAPDVAASPLKPVIEDDDFGAFAPMGGHTQDIHGEAVGALQGTKPADKKTIRAG